MQIRAGVFALLLVAACARGEPVATIHTARGPIEVAVELARTPAEQQRGLMYRNALADGRGMLFIFPEDTKRTFWMKNTLIPLDMIFISREGSIVGIVAETTPLSTTPVGVGAPSRYVLEVPGGWAKRRGVMTGDRVDLPGSGAS